MLVAVGQKALVPHAVEAIGQHMQGKPSEGLHPAEVHLLVGSAGLVVFVAKANTLLIHLGDAVVG